MPDCMVPARFTFEDALRAYDAWGANCGPAAPAVVAGMTLDQVRPHLGDFEQKGYTNPTLMLDSLQRLRLQFRWDRKAAFWPRFGLARIQWEGPWTRPGVPMRVRYRHTHWVASHLFLDGSHAIFDVNCMNVGGWVSACDWTEKLVPWLLQQCEPKADGRWHITHAIEVTRHSLLDRLL